MRLLELANLLLDDIVENIFGYPYDPVEQQSKHQISSGSDLESNYALLYRSHAV